MLSFKPAFSLSSFTFTKRLFSSFCLCSSSSSLPAIKMVSSPYLRVLIFISPGNLDSACALSSPAFHMMYSAYKLNKQGDNIHSWCTPFPAWNQFIVPCLVLIVTSWSAYRLLRRQVWWSGILISLRIFRSLLWSTHLKVLGWSMKQIFFFLILSLFLWSSGCWQFDLWFLCLF